MSFAIGRLTDKAIFSSRKSFSHSYIDSYDVIRSFVFAWQHYIYASC